ncbi:MAG: asparagine synthase-related protein [Methylacidiphilales bacterium]|nr:asparagine synthase-related protein [Candidatus Methylacidiphilales bacterium]
MCSILVTNKSINDLAKVNRYLKYRGPDSTNFVQYNGYNFIHNLLSLTGEFTWQPLFDSENQIVCLFNGEIYNHRAFGEFPSDGYSILAAYRKHGLDFPKLLDGEFAIALLDFKNDLLVVATDTFSTKPLWLSIEKQQIGVSSYRSGLTQLGFRTPRKVEANKILAYKLGSFEKIAEAPSVDFNLEQYKDTYDDWIRAFQEAIAKRAFQSPRQKIFLGLSSGYDSAALACELTLQAVDFKAYTVLAAEDPNIIAQRHQRLAHGQIISLTKSEFSRLKKKIAQECEDYTQPEANGKTYNIKGDQGTYGIACICDAAIQDGRKIYFSGQGSDEVYWDTGYNGRSYRNATQPGVWFPDDLKEIFPWPNFYGGSQQMFLAKEEHVAGTFGIESRYPFLDRNLVQQFLNLSPQLKNAKYKATINEYLSRNNYPFLENVKKGFFAGTNLK